MFYIHVEMSLESYLKVKDLPRVKEFELEVCRGSIGEIRLYQDESGDFLGLVEYLDKKDIEYIAFAGKETRDDTSELRLNHAGNVIQKTVTKSDYDY